MTGYLLDTNTVSEVTYPRPEPKVTALLKSIPAEQMFISAITVGEIKKGILPLPAGKRRSSLEQFLTDVNAHYGPRILPIDSTTAIHWAEIVYQRTGLGRPISTSDALIAATALQHNLTLLTRNDQDFAHTGVLVLNPWT